jgi:hypothetical protein
MSNAPHSLGECIDVFGLPSARTGSLTGAELRAIKEKRELAADIARAAFALDAAKARFDRELTTEAQDHMFECARWLLRLGPRPVEVTAVRAVLRAV